MAIELPKFEDKYGVMLTACGRLKGISRAPSGAAREEKARVARYQTGSGTAFVRSWFTGKKKRQLHIDCALGSVFVSRQKPKATHKKSEVLDSIESVLGEQIDVRISAHFDVPFNDLPETGLIRAFSPEQKSGDMTARLTGCTFSLTGAPVTGVRWNIREEGKKRIVRVSMKAEKLETISEQYLTGLWDWMEQQFRLFVLRRDER